MPIMRTKPKQRTQETSIDARFSYSGSWASADMSFAATVGVFCLAPQARKVATANQQSFNIGHGQRGRSANSAGSRPSGAIPNCPKRNNVREPRHRLLSGRNGPECLGAWSAQTMGGLCALMGRPCHRFQLCRDCNKKAAHWARLADERSS